MSPTALSGTGPWPAPIHVALPVDTPNADATSTPGPARHQYHVNPIPLTRQPHLNTTNAQNPPSQHHSIVCAGVQSSILELPSAMSPRPANATQAVDAMKTASTQHPMCQPPTTLLSATSTTSRCKWTPKTVKTTKMTNTTASTTPVNMNAAPHPPHLDPRP